MRQQVDQTMQVFREEGIEELLAKIRYAMYCAPHKWTNGEYRVTIERQE